MTDFNNQFSKFMYYLLSMKEPSKYVSQNITARNICETFLSLSVSSRSVTRLNALTRSASPNISWQLFRSSKIDKAPWLERMFNSGGSISKSSSASAYFSISSSPSIAKRIDFSLMSFFQFIECISTVLTDVTTSSSWFK